VICTYFVYIHTGYNKIRITGIYLVSISPHYYDYVRYDVSRTSTYLKKDSKLVYITPWTCISGSAALRCHVQVTTGPGVGYDSYCHVFLHSSDWPNFLRTYKTHILSFFREYSALHFAFEVVLY